MRKITDITSNMFQYRNFPSQRSCLRHDKNAIEIHSVKFCLPLRLDLACPHVSFAEVGKTMRGQICRGVILWFLILLFSFSLAAEEWSKSLTVSVTANHSKSKIGSTGQMNNRETLNYGFLINGELTKDIEKSNWKNTLDLEYARSKNRDDSITTLTGRWVENIDLLIIDSVYRWKWREFVNPYIAGNLQTSVLDADYPGEYMAFRPLQVRESIGVGSPVISRKGHEFITRFGFFVQHYVNKPSCPDTYDSSNGIELVFDYKNQFKDDMLFTSKLGFYSSFNETTDPWNTAHKSRKIKLEWDSTFIAKITKYISLNLSYNIDNIDITKSKANYEWEEILNLAFNYKVF